MTAARTVIDAGLSTKQKLSSELNTIGLKLHDIETVLLTHSHHDHAANAAHYDNALIYAADAAAVEASAGIKSTRIVALRGEGILQSNVLAIPTPGHTSDACCFLEVNQHILFTGDTLYAATYGTPRLFHSARAYAASLQRLSALTGVTLLAPGHGPPSKHFTADLAAVRRHLTTSKAP